MASSVAIRLGLEGSAEIKRGLDEVAKSGQAAFDGMSTAADRAGSAADRTMERWKRMAQAARDAQAADQAQAGINRTLGVVDAPSTAASRDRLRDLEAAFAPIPKLVAINDNLTRSIGLQRHEWTNLGRQAGDAITMLAMGSSPLQVIISQADQVRDVLQNSQGGVKGALKEIGSTLLGLVTPGRLAFVGIAAGAGLAAMAMSRAASEANEVNKALRLGSGLRSGMASADFEVLSNTPGLSRAEGRAAALAFAGSGASRANTAAALGITKGLAGAAYDGDIDAAQKGLSDAMRGGTSSLLKYVDGIRPLSTATSDWIERVRATQGEQAANAELLRVLNEGIKAAGLETSLWRQALTGLGNAASDLADSFLKEAQRRANTTAQEAGAIARALTPSGSSSVDARSGRPVAVIGGDRGQMVQRSTNIDIQLPPDGLDAVAGSLADLQAQRERGIAGTKEVRGLNQAYNTDSEALRKLNDDLESYNRLLGDTDVTSQMTKTELAAATVARDRLAASVRSFLTVEQQASQAFDLSRQSIAAYTADQKLAAIAAQRFAEISKDKTRAHLAEAEAQRAVTQETDRWKASAEQGLRAAQDSLKMAGMLPFQRQLAGFAIERDRAIEQFKNPDIQNQIYATRAAAAHREVSAGALNQTTLSINEQVNALRVQRESLFATDEQAATLAARQQLLNEAYRQGIDPTKAYGGQLEDLAKKMGQVAASNTEFQRVRSNITGGMDEIRSSFSGMLSGVTNDLVSGNGKNVGQTLLRSLSRFSDQMMERLVFKPLTETIFGRMGQPGGGWLGSLIGGSGIFGTTPNAPSPLSMPAITAPMATVNATSVVVNGPGFGGIGGGLGLNPTTGQSLQGAGSGILGFGLGGPQSSGAQAALGSGLGMFGFGPNGVSTGSDIMGRFLNAARSGGLTNPYALATLAAYGKHESGWSARNMTGSWSDPSESGEAGTSGGLLSWRNGRLASMRAFTAGDGDPASAQARFFLQENPGLTRALQGSGSLEEANRLMAKSWQFQGWNGGAEFNSRLGTSRGYLNSMGTGPRADAGSFDFDAASKSFAESTKTASQSLTSLSDATAQLPAGADAATSSLTNLLGSLFSAKGGGGFSLANLFGGAQGGETATSSFAGGGWTGSGGRFDPAGIVHRGEYVFSAAAVDRIGLGTLDAMHRGGPGYASGGYVDTRSDHRLPTTSRPLPVTTAPAQAVQPAPPNIVINEAPGVQTSVRQEGNTITIDQVERRIGRGLASQASRNRGEMKDVFQTNSAAMNRG